MAAGLGERSEREYLQGFFIRIGARYRRIRKRSKGKPSLHFVLDNASVHRCKLMRELRPKWEKRGLFPLFLPPYSPHQNIAEMLWRILKGKWIRPVDYVSTDSLLYATNRALAALGTRTQHQLCPYGLV